MFTVVCAVRENLRRGLCDEGPSKIIPPCAGGRHRMRRRIGWCPTGLRLRGMLLGSAQALAGREAWARPDTSDIVQEKQAGFPIGTCSRTFRRTIQL